MTQFTGHNTSPFAQCDSGLNDLAAKYGWKFDGFPSETRINEMVDIQRRIFAIKVHKIPSTEVYGNIPLEERVKKYRQDCEQIAAFDTMKTKLVCFRLSPSRLTEVGWKYKAERTALGNLLILEWQQFSVHFCTTPAQAMFMGNGIFTLQGRPLHPQPETMLDIFELHLSYGQGPIEHVRNLRRNQ